ncbi:hypothetical protein SAMN05216559_2449 [Halomicrobium zhouii]|uniref:DUF2062 domain-containing protein n=1 Tax=Halomicrobium zhouii TaxID=767519 RepID=A0A1I6LC97_9EURY|nr:DUF2062 domain-containing protein [Halomicrobium zhouii]SFS01111.1 hypothetical protein SAMN05216559_2449 [Halomicrobium zhouii]
MFQRVRGSVRENVGRAKRLLRRSFSEDHTTEEVARSFGLGVFITMLPTLGVGFLVFLVLAAVFDSMSKLALVASAVVFNPVVKWGVYGLSLGLGMFLLGPVEGVTMTDASLSAAPAVVLRLVVGNVILAVAVAAVSYVVSFRFIDRYADTAVEYIDDVSDHVTAPFGGTGEDRDSTEGPDVAQGGDDPRGGGDDPRGCD